VAADKHSKRGAMIRISLIRFYFRVQKKAKPPPFLFWAPCFPSQFLFRPVCVQVTRIQQTHARSSTDMLCINGAQQDCDFKYWFPEVHNFWCDRRLLIRGPYSSAPGHTIHFTPHLDTTSIQVLLSGQTPLESEAQVRWWPP
jgi:hypothetical protein